MQYQWFAGHLSTTICCRVSRSSVPNTTRVMILLKCCSTGRITAHDSVLLDSTYLEYHSLWKASSPSLTLTPWSLGLVSRLTLLPERSNFCYCLISCLWYSYSIQGPLKLNHLLQFWITWAKLWEVVTLISSSLLNLSNSSGINGYVLLELRVHSIYLKTR